MPVIMDIEWVDDKQGGKGNGKNKEERNSGQEVITVKLLGGEIAEMARGRLIGYCHNGIHPGMLTCKIMKEHDCIGKQCRFFEKFEDAPFWRERFEHKQKIREIKSWRKKESQSLEDIKTEFQSYAEGLGYDIDIIRVEKRAGGTFRVFYVSENGYNDRGCYPLLEDAIKRYYPPWRVSLRHIRDVDGYYVTREEFYAYRRK